MLIARRQQQQQPHEFSLLMKRHEGGMDCRARYNVKAFMEL